MREFFRGWRRKAGLATLGMALLLMAAWMRSIVVTDVIVVPDVIAISTEPATCDQLMSHRGRVSLFRCPLAFTSFQKLRWETANHSMYFDWLEYLEKEPAEDFVWRWSFGGFVLGEYGAGPDSFSFSFIVVPYWSFVLPLTLLSAWLLLIKPRPAKSAKESSHA